MTVIDGSGVTHRARRPRHVVGVKPENHQQRADRGYSTPDTFSFDHYLAGVIAGGVRELRARQVGHPAELSEDPKGHHTDDAQDVWNALLDRIATGFEIYTRSDGPVNRFADPKVQDAMTLFAKWFPHLWD